MTDYSEILKAANNSSMTRRWPKQILLDAYETIARLEKEIERLNGKTGYCVQCAEAAKENKRLSEEVKRLKGALNKIRNNTQSWNFPKFAANACEEALTSNPKGKDNE